MNRILIILLLISMDANSECFVVGNFKGSAVRENTNFVIESDGLSDQKFIVDIAGVKSKVTPNDMICTQGGLNTVLCFSEGNETASIETWAVYPKSNVAIFTKTRNGLGVFNGGMLFTGKILGKCGE